MYQKVKNCFLHGVEKVCILFTKHMHSYFYRPVLKPACSARFVLSLFGFFCSASIVDDRSNYPTLVLFERAYSLFSGAIFGGAVCSFTHWRNFSFGFWSPVANVQNRPSRAGKTYHAGPDFQDGKALAMEQVVCPGLGDSQHLGYKLRIQKQWEIVMGLINW